MNYKESLYFICEAKQRYEGIMSSFCVYGNNYDKLKQIRELKKNIYALTFEAWKKDKLWEYITNDIEYSDLWKFV